MSACPSCGQVAQGDPDFCPSCGEYLRWEPTGYQQAVEAPAAAPPPPTPPPPAAPAAPGAAAPPPPAGAPPPPAPPAAAPPAAAQPDAVLIALRRADDEGYASSPLDVSVVPGGAVVIRALVRNQSGIVDNYDMSVDGLPEGWWQIAPATVYLVPFGSPGGSYEQEVEVRLSPPRSAEAESRAWEIVVVATSRAHGAEVRSAPTTVEIEPYAELETALTPERRAGRLEAGFTVAVTNRANASADVTFSGVDAEQRLSFSFREPPRPTGGRRISLDELAVKGVSRGRALGVGQGGIEEIGKRLLTRAKTGNEGRLIRLMRRRKRLPPAIEALRIGPGERAEVDLTVAPPKQIWIGRAVMHPFQVVVQPAGADVPAPPAAGTFRQKQWLPWWMLIAIPVVVLLLIWLLSMRTSESTVPDLAAAPDVFAAKALLEDAGLTLGETFEEEREGATEGAIIEQDPAAGEQAAEGAAVSIKVAVGAEKQAVPDLTGRTAEEAKAILAPAGFQLGRPLNEPDGDPVAAKIANQIPVPDSLEAGGAAIDVVFERAGEPAGAPAPAEPPPSGAPPPAPPPGEAPGGAGAPAAPPPAPGPGAVPSGAPVPLPAPPGAPVPVPAPEAPSGVEVPTLTGTGQDEAASALARLGLVPGVITVVSPDVPAGTVAAQDPAPGTEVASGGTVVITISRGYPAIIHTRDGDIVRIGGAAGDPVEPLAATAEVEEEPSASFATPLIVYRRGPAGATPGVAPSAQIWALDPADPLTARPLTDAGFDDGRPAISPDGRVVAFVSNRGSSAADTELCFAAIDATARPPSCVFDRDVAVSRPAWSPDGRALLVTAGDGAQTELLLYTSAVPSSGRAEDWIPQGLVTDAMHDQRPGAQVLSSAFSPDGTQIAFSANWADNTFKLYLLPVTDGAIAGEAQQQDFVAACEVAWRPDGGEIALAQRNTTCDERGRIVRVSLATPNTQTLLSRLDAASGSPVWAPPAPG